MTAQWSLSVGLPKLYSVGLPKLSSAALHALGFSATVFSPDNVNTFGTFLPNTKYLQSTLKSMAFVNVERVVMIYRYRGVVVGLEL